MFIMCLLFGLTLLLFWLWLLYVWFGLLRLCILWFRICIWFCCLCLVGCDLDGWCDCDLFFGYVDLGILVYVGLLFYLFSGYLGLIDGWLVAVDFGSWRFGRLCVGWRMLFWFAWVVKPVLLCWVFWFWCWCFGVFDCVGGFGFAISWLSSGDWSFVFTV